jgi:hypothetical protein
MRKVDQRSQVPRDGSEIMGSGVRAVWVFFDDRLTPTAPTIVAAEVGVIIARPGITEAVLLKDVADVAPDVDLALVRDAYAAARLEVMSNEVDAPTTPLAQPALAAAGAPLPPPGATTSAPAIAYRQGGDTWPGLPVVVPAEVGDTGKATPQAPQSMRHVPWRGAGVAWAVAAVAMLLIVRVVLTAPVDTPGSSRGPSGSQSSGPAAPHRSRRAPGHQVAAPAARDTAGPPAPGSTAPTPSAAPSASASASTSASASPPATSGALPAPSPELTPTVPPTPSPSASDAPPPPVATPVPDPASPSVSSVPIQVTLCDPVLTTCP